MVDADPPRSASAPGRFLTFRSADGLYALPAELVAEVIRTPAATRVPHAPPALLGLANLRGAVMPVTSLARLLGRTDAQASAASRALVLTGQTPVILAVDAVETVVTAEADDVGPEQVAIAAEPGEPLLTFIQAERGAKAKVLDVQALLTGAFVASSDPRAATAAQRIIRSAPVDEVEEEKTRLVVFDVGGQAFALELAAVRELISMPSALAKAPRADARALGVADYRDTLLPVFSLAGLLGLGEGSADAMQKVVVLNVRGALVGLAVDRLRAVASVASQRVEAVPAALAARIGGEAKIKAMVRDEDGRLISILSPDTLFREDVMQRLGQMMRGAADGREAEAPSEMTVLVFRLEDSEYALPIEVVDEVTPVPGQITRLPKTPAFLEGAINLRGEVLPVIDQRRRFDMQPLPSRSGARLIVVHTAQRRAALIVDRVSEVLRRPSESLLAPPDLAGQAARLVSGVLNLESAGRMVLVLDPAELLSQTERALLDAFEAEETPEAP